MGSAVGTATSRGENPPTREEMVGYRAVKEAYEALTPDRQRQDVELLGLATLYQQVISERQGRNTGDRPSMIEAFHSDFQKLLAMSEEEKSELGRAVLAAVVERENIQRTVGEKDGSYGKSFGGTKQDTQVENEFANLLRGQGGTESEECLPLLLRRVQCNDEKELEELRSAGKWLRYLGSKGCYLWIHPLTREVTALRPQDFEEEDLSRDGDDEHDITGGFPSCALPGLSDMVAKIIDDDKKTPLLIDNSEDGKVSAFLSYKAVLVDVSVLAIGYQKSGTKVSDLMETVRARAVGAMKSGSTLALRLGYLTSDHANFKRKLCTRGVFPAEMFQEGGKKMFTPQNKPRCNLMFRDEDMDQGQCFVRPEGFRFCAITALPQTEVIGKLGDTLPLGYMQPLYVT